MLSGITARDGRFAVWMVQSRKRLVLRRSANGAVTPLTQPAHGGKCVREQAIHTDLPREGIPTLPVLSRTAGEIISLDSPECIS